MFSIGGKGKDVATPRICDVVWRDGEFIKWNDARVHVMSHVLHYGSSVFEGIRCYATKKGPAVFRLREHMQRFLNSAKIYRMDHKWTIDDFCEASVELCRRSDSTHIIYIFINHGKASQSISLTKPMQEILSRTTTSTIQLPPQGVAVFTAESSR